ncbi:MAG: ATP-binding cassette domain-containing protein [Chitinophagia bacterium]|nr:ATP-binding cassette domain-containing protein [Chitinophagia bacterium]
MKKLDSTAKQLLGYTRGQWKTLTCAFVLFAFAGAVEPAIPALFKKLIDSGFKDGLNYPLWLVPLVIIGLFLLRGGLNFVATYIIQTALGEILLNLRLDLMKALLRARSDVFISLSQGQVVNKIVYDPQWASQVLGGTLINIVKDSAILICLVAYLLYLNWQLTLLAFICMPLLALAVRKAQKRLEQVGQSLYESQQRLIDIVDDNARAWRVVRTFGATGFEERRFENEAQRLRRFYTKQMATGALVTPITQLVAAIGVSVIVTLALYQADQGSSTVGEFVSFIMALLMVISPMRHLSDVFQPVAGEIRIDGVSISELSLSSLRQHFSVVSQDIILFDGSVAQNVAYANEDHIDRSKVEACLQAANLWPHINSLPQGIDSSIGVNGNLLSGGQRQRLAIARALYRDAPIWIFDEATSALDSESETLIQKSIESLRRSKTILVIAHRLSTVKHADQICVMSAGQIIERGSHDELMVKRGKYSEMVKLQAG